jgi:hypothetical protein
MKSLDEENKEEEEAPKEEEKVEEVIYKSIHVLTFIFIEAIRK